MRIVFGMLGLFIVLAIVALLASKQLGSRAIDTGGSVPATSPGATQQQQSQQIQQQVKQSVEGAMQQARPEPADK